ncbi:MAG: Flp family type IVb pilin [Robiginitomaculum sp.]|nr:Flp family type IVb pilin [Robiginitomaculum sp.]
MCKKRKNTVADFVRNLVQNFARANDGATAIEYGLIVALLGVGLIVGADGIASAVTTMWETVSNDMASS